MATLSNYGLLAPPQNDVKSGRKRAPGAESHRLSSGTRMGIDFFLKANVTSPKGRASDALMEGDKVREVEGLQKVENLPVEQKCNRIECRGGGPALGTPLILAVTTASLVSSAGRVLQVGRCRGSSKGTSHTTGLSVSHGDC